MSSDKRSAPTYRNHTNCSKKYSDDSNLKIEIEGNLFCNGCHKKDRLVDWTFSCDNHGPEKVDNLAYLLEVLQVMIIMSKNICDQKKFVEMISNICSAFEK